MAWEDLRLRCRDGVSLAARRWRPQGSGSWPVLLMRQPYGRAIASTVTYAHPSWYAAQGYQVVVVDVRGRGESDGQFRGFAQEAADGADCVRWARHLDHANGRVGTYGFSYQGLSQLLSDGSAPHDVPDALAPAHCGLDERCHWASEGGAHWWALGLGWALQLAAQGCARRDDGDGWLEIRRSLDTGTFLRQGLSLLQRHDPDGMGLAWLGRDPASSEGWTRHQAPVELLRRPMLLIGGWYDPHLLGVLDLWRQARAAGGDPWLRIGAWSHLDWRGGLDALQLAFFDRHLKAAAGPPLRPESSPPPLLLERLGDGAWLSPDPAVACGPAWRLRSRGLAAICADEGLLLPYEGAPEPERGAASLTLVHDPWRPVPGRGGHLGLDAGPADRADLDARSDVVCFSTAPLSEPLELVGQPELRIVVAADQASYDLCGALSVVAADGVGVRQSSTGVLRCQADFSGPPQPRSLLFQPVLLALQPGERLRLSLAASAWPQIGVNSGDLEVPPGPVTHRHRVITLTFELAGAQLRLRPLASARPD
ncbi:CocE/NonD family hydrolase [Synechococcus sp. CS-1328]|uniref:CocE/NonD family hydrolase n=1 Tax=Synechococcus sp. CS-1328 TaxID=2847976 RepID=UPI00223A9D0F|nr:CocE/NonD family hydrolase [Synechococcus sp. CS-1328]MCT0226204.1 CocE/NonD family hydrolase [Synechococcus sp. CS-1328]